MTWIHASVYLGPPATPLLIDYTAVGRVPTSRCSDAVTLAVEQSADLRQVTRPLDDVLEHARLQ